MVVYMMSALIFFASSLNSEPLLFLASQLDQMRQAASVTSKVTEITEELAFAPGNFFLEDVGVFERWVGNVKSHIENFTDATFRGKELKNIVSAAQKNVERLVGIAINVLSQNGDFNRILLNVLASSKIAAKLNVLIDLCHKNDVGEACSWVENERKNLDNKLGPIKEQIDKNVSQKKIDKIWNEWKVQEEKWKSSSKQKRYSTLIIAGKEFDPDTITSAQEQEIYHACSWEGLAKAFGINGSENLQQLVTAKLIEGKVMNDENEAIEEVDGAIIDKLTRLVTSLIGFYEYKTVLNQGEQNIISKVTVWNLKSFENCIKDIASFCQISKDFNEIQTKYKNLIEKAFRKHDTWKKYGGNIQEAWCTVVEKTALDSYESLLKSIVKLIPSNIVDSKQWSGYVARAKDSFRADWSKYKTCVVKRFDIEDALDRAKEAREL